MPPLENCRQSKKKISRSKVLVIFQWERFVRQTDKDL